MPNDWSLADIYHHVLKQSPSPEAAKIAISKAQTNGRLPLYCERFERKVKNAPPPEGEKVFPPDEVLRDHQITEKQFSTWDWGRSYATRVDSTSKSHFEYKNIRAPGDVVLSLWPKRAEDVRPRGRPGPPTTHDWFAICGEIARRCINPKTKGLAIPRSENKLAEEVLGWYYDLNNRRPAESEMRKAVKQVLAALREV
jgi:hypothetical protein